MSGFIRDFFSVGLSKIGIILFGLGRAIITARWLGPEGNGVIAALAVYPALFMTIGSLGIRQSVAYYVGKKIYNDNDIKTSLIQIWFFTTMLTLTSCYFLIRYFSNSGYNLFWVLLSIIPIPFNLFNTYNSGVFLGKNQIQSFNKINWLPIAVIFVFTILLVIIFPWGIDGALGASITGPLLMSFILMHKSNLVKSFNLNFDFKIIRSLLSLGMIYAFALLIINLNTKLDIILLDKLSSPFEVGIYSKGATVTEYLWQIPMLLSTIVFARSANAKDGLVFSGKVTQLLRITIVIVGAASIFLVFASRFIIVGMYGADFINSTRVLQLLLPGVLLLTVFKTLNQDLAGKGKPWISMKAMIPALLINVILNIILIPNYGANGAAIASTISYSFAAIVFILVYSREVKIPIKDILRYSKSDFDFLRLLKEKIQK
jgi:O-antigen/teichoic acid export membrane protein